METDIVILMQSLQPLQDIAGVSFRDSKFKDYFLNSTDQLENSFDTLAQDIVAEREMAQCVNIWRTRRVDDFENQANPNPNLL
jgi:hypothetical protein